MSVCVCVCGGGGEITLVLDFFGTRELFNISYSREL